MQRSARRSAERIASRVTSARSAHDQIADDPGDQRENDRSHDGGTCEPLQLTRIEPAAGVPDQVTDAAECMMCQPPRAPEQYEAADEGAEEPLHVRVCGRSGGGGEQPPGDE